MSIFLFLKPIVDMCYQLKWMDYVMVVFALVLFGYQMVLVRPNIRARIGITDTSVILIALILTVTFARSGNGYTVYFKVLSGLLLYFVGRIYYDRILECTDALVFSSYLIVILNVIHRLVVFGLGFLKVTNASGDFYYSDTDMAVAMVLAFIFIAMFGKSRWYKALTLLIICPYMVFASDAGVQKVLLVAMLFILLVFIWEWVSESKTVSNILLIILTLGLLGLLVLIYTGWKLPVLTQILDNGNMKYRITGWSSAVKEIVDSSGLQRAFGVGMGIKYDIGSLYLKTLYSVGIAGAVLGVLVVLSIVFHTFMVEDRKTYYATMMLLILFLGTGATVNCMESVQISWLPLMFAGMTVSSVQVQRTEWKGYRNGMGEFDSDGIFHIKRAFTICNVVGICPSTKQEFVDTVYSFPKTPVSATVDLVGMPAIISAKENSVYADMYRNSTMTAIDGMPFARMANRRGIRCERCAAPDIMGPVLEEGLKRGATHYFYGGKNDELLGLLRSNLEKNFPGIKILGMYSPPFRPLTPEEDEAVVNEINSLKPDFLWVGIGAPKQEMWMQNHRESIKETCMMGVGAAFDFFAGTLSKAPVWMENAGLEWLYRLIKEPKRLWKRYILGGIKYCWYSFTAIFGK